MSAGFGIDGSLADVPGLEIPDPEDPRLARGPCRVRVVLDRVSYGGDDIGSRWRLKVTAGDGFWLSGPIDLPHGTARPIGVEISSQLLDGQCGLATTVAVVVRAQERSFPAWPFKVGEAVRIALSPCRTSLSMRQEFMLVPVRRRWPPRGLVAWNQTAVLTFTFTVSSQCA